MPLSKEAIETITFNQIKVDLTIKVPYDLAVFLGWQMVCLRSKLLSTYICGTYFDKSLRSTTTCNEYHTLLNKHSHKNAFSSHK